MKGKSLQLLIDELNKAERHQVLNSCKRSGDKRHLALYELMKSSYAGKKEFSEYLDKCSKRLYDKKYNAAEQDKIQRRFIDFSVKEIENIKIKNFLSVNLAERNHLLSEIYNHSSPEILFRYVQKSAELSKNSNRSIYAEAIDREIQLRSYTHTKKEITQLRQLLVIKNGLIQKNYHGELSRIYELLSLLEFEDRELTQELGALILHEEEAEALIGLSAGMPEEAEYLVARARFVFYEREKFNAVLQRAKESVRKIKSIPDHKKLNEKVVFIDVLHHFHFGFPAGELAEKAKPLISSSDELHVFYSHFFRLLAQAEKDRMKCDVKEIQKIKFSEQNEFRKDFLLALAAFAKKDHAVAIKKLAGLTYHDNHQLSLWARVMEITIHLEKGNDQLCESLLNRFKRTVISSKTRLFTHNSAVFSLKILQNALRGKKAEKPISGLTCLHTFLLPLDNTRKSN
ncbi:MAG: hypothetical protein ACOZCO_02505 [Bacteroidota bacterium]